MIEGNALSAEQIKDICSMKVIFHEAAIVMSTR